MDAYFSSRRFRRDGKDIAPRERRVSLIDPKRRFETGQELAALQSREIVEIGTVARRRLRRGNHRSGRIEPLPSAGVVVGELYGV